ncbi:MAG TPA: hypothetical protein VMH22_04010 [bacterium]|nr:hypothetical protein [bacterium]
MKKLMVVVGIVVLLVAAHFVAVTTLNRQVQDVRRTVQAAGHPMTMKELAMDRAQGSKAVSRLLAQADTALDEKKEKGLLAQADSGRLDPAAAKALLGRNGRALDLLLAAARYPAGSMEFDPGAGLAAKLPPTLKRTFDFGALLRLQARDLLAAGKPDEAMDVLISNLHLADLLPSGTELIFSLARATDLNRTLRVMRDVGPRCSDPALARAADAVAAVARDKELLRVWETEYVTMDEYLARPTTAALGLANADNLVNRFLIFFPLTNRIAQSYSQAVHKRCLEIAACPWYEANRQWDSLDRVQQLRGRQHSPLAGLMLPNGKLVATRIAKLQAEQAVTLTGLRILQYRKNHGTFPSGLADVSVQNVTDPFTGKSLNYRAVGTGFQLYSLGEDQQDNGGDPKTDIAWSELQVVSSK